jgi:hypothetical protein
MIETIKSIAFLLFAFFVIVSVCGLIWEQTVAAIKTYKDKKTNPEKYAIAEVREEWKNS